MLNHGRFLIKNEEIKRYLELPLDSHLEFSDSDDGIEIYVVSDKNHEMLTEKGTSQKSHLRREPIYL